MVYRLFVEKKEGLRVEAEALQAEIRDLLGISALKSLRLLNRYDVEKIDQDLFEACIYTVFAEPQTDYVYHELPQAERIFAVEYLPGQFDQRADSAAQCIQLISEQERPLIKTAKVYLLEGDLDDAAFAAIKHYLINPVESREASLAPYDTLQMSYDIPHSVPVLEGFINSDEDKLKQYLAEYALAMDIDDLRCCRDYFHSEKRDPTITEIRVLDGYWSDHCRHTTFNTFIDDIKIADEDVAQAYQRYLDIRHQLGREQKPVTLMDMATIAARYLKQQGILRNLDESPEINACTVKIKVAIDGEPQDWLLLFKNETHNHPTEIEPFGGAATCLGGAIRDPLSGRAYVYQAMRLTGAADPTKPLATTLPGKLPQRKIVTAAAAGYSSYGNQVGLATGMVDEWYHEGYLAKRMEIGAVIGAAPEENVRRLVPSAGDVVILLGGRTGRDGCGGATGSSKSHDTKSIETSGAEVQKGNAPEERKLQRLFRMPEAAQMIKRCNDFGAGGVSVALGELSDGLHIDLDKVPKKYDGLDGTELAISESQERMAVVVARENVERFCQLAAAENLEATMVAQITTEPRLVMEWQGQRIVDLSRKFLNTNGSEKHTRCEIAKQSLSIEHIDVDFITAYQQLAADLNCCSHRGLAERFDSTIGANTVLMPFGGKKQLTPIQAMVAKLPVLAGETTTCSVMSWGFDPYLSQQSPFHGSYLAVVSSVQKLVATGAGLDNCYLTFQEYFAKLGQDAANWGQPASALLGALSAQLDLGLAAIGGKDSMSGSFETISVPPTLVSFAVSLADVDNVISPEFKKPGSQVVLLQTQLKANGLPDKDSICGLLQQTEKLIAQGKVLSAYVPGHGGIAEAVMKMCLGNDLGFAFADDITTERIFAYCPAAFILELADDMAIGTTLGHVTAAARITSGEQKVELAQLLKLSEQPLEGVFPLYADEAKMVAGDYSYQAKCWPKPMVKAAKPQFTLPVFPGTNCEYDTARAIEKAGGRVEMLVINNLNASGVKRSVELFAQAIGKSQAIVIPGGFSGGDEPDGSGKFITAFFRNPEIKEQVELLLNQRDGLMCGICNGFQALIKLGLVPFGKIIDTDATCPTLTFNTIGRHQSRLVRTKVVSNKSPWLAKTAVGDIYNVPISHGEGRFVCSDTLLKELAANGQIALQYVDDNGEPTMDIHFNPNGSIGAIECITSPDGRVLGKMGHAERVGYGLYKNVPGNYQIQLFEAAVDYFRG